MSNQKENIINLFKENGIGKSPIELLDNPPYEDVYGIYKYRNDIFCFKSGMDIPFDDLTELEKNRILEVVKSGKYKANKTLQ